MKRAVIVASGGLDSITNGLIMLSKGYDCLFLHFNYMQKCEEGELLSCRKIVDELNKGELRCDLEVVDLPEFEIIGSGRSLVDKKVGIIEGMESIEMSSKGGGNIFVPSRNVVFLAFASAWAEYIGAKVITLGCNQSERTYKDNTKEFLDRFTSMLEYGTLEGGIKVISPEWELDKPDILKWGFDNGFGWVYKYTYSCDDSPVVSFNVSDEKRRESILTCGRDGCCCNRRFAFYVAEKLWGIKDNQMYKDEGYFYDVFLEELKEKCKEDWWQYKYLKLIC